MDEKYNSVNNINQSEKKPTNFKSLINDSSETLTRNFSTFSTSSLSFRFWNNKNKGNIYLNFDIFKIFEISLKK